jgi:hypothetical protein
MDEKLIEAYRTTDYRVRLPRGGWVSIRVDAAIPEELLPWTGKYAWAFITAWNPRSEVQPRTQNRAAQQSLLVAIRELRQTICVRPGMGVGENWREPSFFVVGPDLFETDRFAQQFRQNAYVHGLGTSPARLRLTGGSTPHGQAG